MSKNVSMKYSLDWTTVFYYVVLVFMGWISIYGASYDFDQTSILDWDQRAGKQFVWILTAFGLGGMLLLIDYKMYNFFAYFIYGFTIALLIITIFVAPDIKGSRSWLVIGRLVFSRQSWPKWLLRWHWRALWAHIIINWRTGRLTSTVVLYYATVFVDYFTKKKPDRHWFSSHSCWCSIAKEWTE